MTDAELFPTEKAVAILCTCRHPQDRHVDGVGCTDCAARAWPCAEFVALQAGDEGKP